MTANIIRFLRVLSAGNAFDVVAGILAWPPLGRRVSLLSVEGPGRDQIEDRAFVVKEMLNDNLVMASQASGTDGSYLLCPRHRGWTARSLIGTSIAVTVRPQTAAGAGDAIGIAVVRLSK